MTVRQMFYQLVSSGAVAKTEGEYNKVGYHLLNMRRRDIIPYSFIADNTRWMRKPTTYDSIERFLQISKDTYRRSLWANQAAYIEIWVEKEALAGVFSEITREWDVPLMVTRGFPSESFVFEAAEAIKAKGKNTYLYYFGDYDPSGVAISDNLQEKLYNFGVCCHFDRVAVNEGQISTYNLPERPTKKSDTRAKHWYRGSVELDAIPVNVLREMIKEVILKHIDRGAYEECKRQEKFERQTFETFVENFGLA